MGVAERAGKPHGYTALTYRIGACAYLSLELCV